MRNPIIDNRIVNDETFAKRLNTFLSWIPTKFILSKPYIYEEYHYLLEVARNLLEYQHQTVKDELEIKYLNSIS